MKHLDDSRIVAGFLKEAMFYSRLLQIEGHRFKGEAHITDFHESSSRAKDLKRFLYLTFSSKSPDEVENIIFHFRCPFPHCIGSWKGNLERTQDGQFKTQIPAEINISNQRNEPRIALFGGQNITIPVLVCANNIHTDALLTIEDFSSKGIGGKLKVPFAVPISSETRIFGYWGTSSGSLRIAGSLVQAQLTQPGRSEASDSIFQVGILQQLTENNKLHNSSTERRKFKRDFSDFPLQVFSPLNPTHPIDLAIINASATGFAAIPVDPASKDLLPIGCGVSFEKSTLIAELMGFTQDNLRFQIIGGTAEDRLKWLKNLTAAQHVNTFNKSATGVELIDLFCESGAAAAAFLKAQSAFSTQFTTGLASNFSERNWIHRWIERTTNGKIRGHICAIRLADSLWYIGDLAGMILKERKLSKTFIPRFFESFKEYCLASSPCPKIITTWTKGHPYWKDFEKYLVKKSKDTNVIFAWTNYFRFPKQPSEKRDNTNFEFTEILASQHSEIQRILKNSDENCTLLTSLDLTEMNFASPILTKALHESNHLLRRKYVRINFDNHEFILVLQSYPLGSSQNRTPDVPWLVPLKRTALSEPDRISLYLSIQNWSLKHGYHGPGILEVFSEKTSLAKPVGAKEMLWSIYHPELLSYFVST